MTSPVFIVETHVFLSKSQSVAHNIEFDFVYCSKVTQGGCHLSLYIAQRQVRGKVISSQPLYMVGMAPCSRGHH